MKIVKGVNKGSVVLYALSTCGWCAKTKALLKELGVAYKYADVDLLTGKAREDALAEIDKHNPEGGFPTIIINNKCVAGFNEEEIRKCLK